MASQPLKPIATAIAAQLDRQGDSKQAARQIAAYLVDNKSVKDTAKLVRLVETIRNKRGVVEAVLSSAYPVESGQRSQIERIIRNHIPNATKIIITERIDPSLIGGVRVHVAGKEFDLTVRDKLTRLKHI